MLTVSKERWLARLSILLIAGAFYLLIEFAGLLSLALIGSALLGICVTVACAYWFLAHRGVVRWLSLIVAVLAPVAVNVLFARHSVLWVALASLALLLAAAATARASMGPAKAAMGQARTHRHARLATPPERAFLIMNPRSGGGKVGKFGLKEKAEHLGAEVAMISGPVPIDIGALAE